MSVGEILFSFKGRIGIGTFFAATVSVIIVALMLLGLVIENGDLIPLTGDPNPLLVALLVAPMVIILGISIWMSLAIFTKRWHDIGWSGWMNLTLVIPLVGLISPLFLALLPGKAESNKYGEALWESFEE